MTRLSGTAQHLLAPRSIALVGASADERKHSALPLRYLRRHGYDQPVYPVNPNRSVILGEPAYPSVHAIGKPVDHAFILVPTAAVEEAVADCVAAGVRCATILSDGFAEAGGEGRALQERVLARARQGGMRVLGPNSLGVVNPVDRVALSANEALSLPALRAGRLGLISQSGSLIGALLSRGDARGIGFSRMVSVGNEADLGVAEIGEMLVDDPETAALLLFLETVRDADALAAMAQRAYAAGKPVVAFRLGRSALGATLAASHTGALVGEGAAIDAFLDDVGIVRVELLETLLDIPTLLIGRRPAAGQRVTVMSTTGGGGGLVVDSLCERGVELVPADAPTIASLGAEGIAIAASPLIDLTLAGTNPAVYGPVLRALLASSACDAVVAVIGSSAQFRPDRAVEPTLAVAGGAGTPGARAGGATKSEEQAGGDAAAAAKPVAVFLTPQADVAYSMLHDGGVAAFRTPESCADAVRSYLRWRAPREAPATRATGLDAAARALQAHDPRGVFTALGVPYPAGVLVVPGPGSFDDPRLDALAFPVAIKIVSRDILHKTEAGGVVLGIGSRRELEGACRAMLDAVRRRQPDAAIEGVLVETMERGLAEALVGFRRDPSVGPTVTLGVGGVLAEVYRDFVTRTAPVDVETAHAMIGEVRGLAPIRGYRGLPRGDLDALARTVRAVSWLAVIDAPRVREAEINPVLVKRQGEGVVALDAVVMSE